MDETPCLPVVRMLLQVLIEIKNQSAEVRKESYSRTNCYVISNLSYYTGSLDEIGSSMNKYRTIQDREIFIK